MWSPAVLTRSALLAVAGAVLLSSPASAGLEAHAATHRATTADFAGEWIGHTRGLTISSRGHATESIGSGCCDPIVDVRFALSQVHGNNHVATARIRVTAVTIKDRSAFTKAYPAPRVGQTGRLRLRYGVISESVTRTNYCNEAAGARGVCGA